MVLGVLQGKTGTQIEISKSEGAVREVVLLVEPIDLAMYVIKSKTQTTLDKWGSKRQLGQELKDALRNLARIRDNDRYDADGDPHGAYDDLDSHFYRKETEESRDFWRKWDEIPEHVKYHNLEEGHPLRPSRMDVILEHMGEEDPDDLEWTNPLHPKYGEKVTEEDLPEFFGGKYDLQGWPKIEVETRDWMNRYHTKHGTYEHISHDLPGRSKGRNPKLTVQQMVEGPAKDEGMQTTLPMYDWSLDKYGGWKGVEPVMAWRENPRWSNLMAVKRGLPARPMEQESIIWDDEQPRSIESQYENWRNAKLRLAMEMQDYINYWRRAKWDRNPNEVVLGPDTAGVGSPIRSPDEPAWRDISNGGLGLIREGAGHPKTMRNYTIDDVIDELRSKKAAHLDDLTDKDGKQIPMEDNTAFHKWNVENRTLGDRSLQRPVRRQQFLHRGRKGTFVYPPNRKFDRRFTGITVRDFDDYMNRGEKLSRDALGFKRIRDALKEPWSIHPAILRTTRKIGIRGDPFKMRGQFANLGLGGERAEAFLEEDVPPEHLVFGGLPNWMTDRKKLRNPELGIFEGKTAVANQWPHMGFDMVDALNAQGVSSGAPIVGWEQDGANFHFKDVMGNIVHSMTADEARKYAGDERGWVNEAV